MNSETFFSEDQTFALSSAMLVYSRGSEALATVHNISLLPHTERPYVAPGVPASKADFIEVARQMENRKENIDKPKIELFPANLLTLGSQVMAWHVPSQVRPLFVSTGDKTFNADLNGKPVMHPTLLFVAGVDGRSGLSRGSLYVYALGDDSRPTMETPLYRAPYLNVYEGGHLCEGSYRLPEVLRPADIPQWEGAFFDTHFSHTNVDGRHLCAHQHGHNAMWRDLSRLHLIRSSIGSRRKSEFPLHYLNRLAKPSTVGEALGA